MDVGYICKMNRLHHPDRHNQVVSGANALQHGQDVGYMIEPESSGLTRKLAYASESTPRVDEDSRLCRFDLRGRWFEPSAWIPAWTVMGHELSCLGSGQIVISWYVWTT